MEQVKVKVRPVMVLGVDGTKGNGTELADKISSLSSVASIFGSDFAFQSEIVAMHDEVRQALGINLVMTSFFDQENKTISLVFFPLTAGLRTYKIENDDQGIYIEAYDSDVLTPEQLNLNNPSEQ